MKKFKRIAAILLACVLLVSTLCVPAFAAEDASVVVTFHSYDASTGAIGDEITSANAGDYVIAVLGLKAGSEGLSAIAGCQLYAKYDASILVPGKTGKAPFKALAYNVGSNTTASEFAWTMSGANKNGAFNAVGGGSADLVIDAVADEVITLGQYAFKVAADVESVATAITLDSEKNNVVFYYPEGSSETEKVTGIDMDNVYTLNVVGVAPTLSTVTLDKASALADGTNAATVKASAASAKGTNITNSVAWSVEPAGKGVTAAADGTVTVDAKAVAGTYTVTATADGVNVLGTTAAATFTVTRNPSVLTDIELSAEAVTVDGKNDQTVTVDMIDQYGSAMDAAVSVDPAEGITVSGSTITVAKDAAEGTYTVTVGDKTATFTVARTGAGVVTEFTANAVTTPIIIPASGSTTVAEVTLGVSDAKDVYGTAVSNPEVTYTLKDTVAGITVEDGTLKVTADAAKAIETSKEITVIAAINGIEKEIKVTVERAPSVATSMAILSDGAEVGTAITVGIPTAGKAFTAEVRDQYGTKMDVAATLKLESAADGISFADGKLAVADTTADGATATLKASYNGLTDSVAIEAKTVAVDWTGVAAANIEYGKTKADAITLPSGTGAATGYIDGVATAMDGTFEVVDAAAVPAAGSAEITVKFTITSDGIYKGTEFTSTYTVSVAQKALTLADGSVVVTKEYDGKTDAGALTGALALTGVVGSDDVSVDMTGVSVSAYPVADYGTHTVKLSGIALTGAAAANYTVASTYDFAGATITKTVLKASDFTVDASTTVTYDGAAKTVTVTPNVTGAGAVTVLYNGETSAVNAGEYAITIDVAEGTNYAAATALDLSAKLIIEKAARTVTPSAATVVLVGETPVDVTIATDAEAEITDASFTVAGDEVTELTYAAGVASFVAAGCGTDTVALTVAESANYLAGAAEIKVIAISDPIDGYAISGAFGINCTYGDGEIVMTAKSVNPDNVEIEFLTPEVAGATITVTPNPVPVTATELTVTIEAAGQTITVPYTVSIDIEKVAAKVNLTADELGIVDVLPDEVYDEIFAAAEEKSVDEVDVSVTTEVKVEDGKITITPTYTVTDTETGDVLIEDGAIESTTAPVAVEVELEDEAEGTKLMVKNAAGEYETVVVTDKKITVETDDFTAPIEIVVPATITINYTYNKAKEDGSTTESIEYDIDDLGAKLPEDSKAGHTFKGWQIGEKVYTTLTADLLDAEDGSEYDATASFKKKSSGGGIAYVISVEDADNGTVKASKKTAGKGDTVTITVKPDKGYELDELTVTDKNGDELKLKSKGDGKYTFTMPKGKVYVEATFEAVEVEVEASFSDVAETDSYFNAVEWAVAEGVTTGYANGTFLPNNTVTRAQAVTFLWRAMGEPEPETAEMPFVDVPVGSYYYDAVLWAVENGITTGMTATTFVPDKTVSRAQTITFLWRTAKMEGYDVSVGAETNILSYADASSIGEYAIPAMQWACGEEIVSSYADGTLRPNDGCTRAQTVTFLYRFLG